MLPNVGMGELLVILMIMLLLFGAKRLPEVAKGLGKSIRSFKDGMAEAQDELRTPPANAEPRDPKKDLPA